MIDIEDAVRMTMAEQVRELSCDPRLANTIRRRHHARVARRTAIGGGALALVVAAGAVAGSAATAAHNPTSTQAHGVTSIRAFAVAHSTAAPVATIAGIGLTYLPAGAVVCPSLGPAPDKASAAYDAKVNGGISVAGDACWDTAAAVPSGPTSPPTTNSTQAESGPAVSPDAGRGLYVLVEHGPANTDLSWPAYWQKYQLAGKTPKLHAPITVGGAPGLALGDASGDVTSIVWFPKAGLAVSVNASGYSETELRKIVEGIQLPA